MIVRQRPATARGFVFMSLEDETGIANVIVTPDVFERVRPVLVEEHFLLIEGAFQRQDGVVSVHAERMSPPRSQRWPRSRTISIEVNQCVVWTVEACYSRRDWARPPEAKYAAGRL